MRFFWVCLWVLLPSTLVIALEPDKQLSGVSAIDMELPIHQQKKLHPELSDPVLGDQAQIVEWAWSPQYAERFGLPVQSDGLPNGGLWLVGIKIQRSQYQQWQDYDCKIVGVMQNDLQILTPPGDIYTIHPFYQRFGGLPPVKHHEPDNIRLEAYTPFQSAWYRYPKNKLEQIRPESGISVNYLVFYRHFQTGLAYFEVDGACGYFNDPKNFHNEIRFPKDLGKAIDTGRASRHIQIPGIKDYDRFEFPEAMMSRIYPYIREAVDWQSCFMTRIDGRKAGLSLHALKTKRFGNSCEPVPPAKK